jgi:6-phosphogluconolactonase/glucosamine-6-phosphate isomerase/deaminase
VLEDSAATYRRPPNAQVDEISDTKSFKYLPFEVIEASSRIAFLVTGARKKEIIHRIFHPLSGEAEDLPASILYRRRPDAHWFMDSFAALSKKQGENNACRPQ